MHMTTFLSSPKIQKKCPLICFQVKNNSYVTLLLWGDTKLLSPDLGSDISDCDLLVPRSHETCFCRFFTQKTFFFFQRKIRYTRSEFQRPKSPANSQGVSQSAHRDLQHKKDSRPLPRLTSYPWRFGIHQKLF